MLMVMFLLAYIGYTYTLAKRVVYSFHIPAFLVIPGYLTNTNKSPRAFTRAMLWQLFPYTVMESGYTAATQFPIREHIGNLTLEVFLDKLLLHPLGPYWYLHSLVLHCTTHYAVATCWKFTYARNRVLSCALLLYLFSLLGVISFANGMYYLCGPLSSKKETF